MRTVVVTGASGFAGGHLLELLAREDDARLIAWRGPGAPDAPRALDAVAVAWHEVDLLDGTAVSHRVAADPPADVYHLAGAAQVAGSWDRAATTLAVNVLGTHRLLEALHRFARAARVLMTCSGLVYRGSSDPLDEDAPVQPANPYALSKLAQEGLGLQAWQYDRQPVVVARAFNHVGPGQGPQFFAASFARQIARIEAGLDPPVIRVGNLDARRDLTDVRDTVRAYRALMRHGAAGRVYNVCSGRAQQVRDVLDALVARARVSVRLELDPARLRPVDLPVVVGNAARLARETGWAPIVPLQRTLADILDDWRERVRNDPSS